MKSVSLVIALAFSSLLSHELSAQTKNPPMRYNLSNLKQDFTKMALANINMKVPHVWEFLVTGNSESTLLQAREEFTSKGFRATKMYKESKQNYYILVLEVEKIYTAHSLFEDTQVVEALVKRLELRSFEKLNIIK